MKNNLITLRSSETILKEFAKKKERVVITKERLVLENAYGAMSVRIDMIGAVEMEKRGRKLFLRLFSKEGNNLFPYAKEFSLQILSTDEATEFEQVLSQAIFNDFPSEEEGQ